MLQGLIYAVISAAAFGSLAVLVKLGYDAGLSGAEMMQYRFTIAALILGLILLVRDRSLLAISRTGLAWCALIGMVIYWLQTSCFVRALETIPASTAALILYFYPVTVTLLSALIFRTKLARVVFGSLALVVAGCCLVFYDAFLKEADPTGLLYAVGAMCFFTCYLMVVQRALRNIKPLTATFYVMLFAGVSFTLSGDPGAWLTPTWERMAFGLSLGVVPGVVAVAFLYMAVEKVGSAYASIFSSIEPVVTLAGAALLLDENVVLLQIGGTVLIIAGVVIPNLRALALRRQVNAPARRP
ncbi:EamA family transporter [Pseudodesulfovibrio sp. F-1]|uniref:EamA family transporter n=1 Tax=Pseudodesulfovibrio alkaliphilus TaxID=2661613 RepID=A0A7K1KL75_9BACT|nr:DMT family transporter [Pseudodesulfovibrio alkaliphilus]MUM76828.1 EamA family transporter [Pseudodesulfovibrio alkaliphilus]